MANSILVSFVKWNEQIFLKNSLDASSVNASGGIFTNDSNKAHQLSWFTQLGQVMLEMGQELPGKYNMQHFKAYGNNCGVWAS